MVLDALADDVESVETMRDHGEVTPYGLARVDERDVVDAVRDLLDAGLIVAWEPSERAGGLVPNPLPGTDAASLRRYWFEWTPAGEHVWREGHDLLDAYWTAHPPGG